MTLDYYRSSVWNVSTYNFPEEKVNLNIKVPAINKNAPKAPKCPAYILGASKPLGAIRKIVHGRMEVAGVGKVETYLVRKINAEIALYKEMTGHVKRSQAAERLKKIMLECFPTATILQYGSFAVGLDVSSSDLDFSVHIPGKEGRKMLEDIEKAFKKLKETFSKVKLICANVPVLKLTDKKTGVEMDVCTGSLDGMRNTQLLACYARVDPRIPLLIKAVKDWATKAKVENSADGKLNGLSVCFLVISFLQVGVQPCVAPNLQELVPELQGEYDIVSDEYGKKAEELVGNLGWESQNTMDCGELFLAFLAYYAVFDFENHWISIRRGAVLPKRRDEEGKPLDGMPDDSKPIVIADPHLKTPKNNAYTLTKVKTFRRLQQEFKLSLERILEIKSLFEMGEMSECRGKLNEEARARDSQLVTEREEYIEKNGKDSWRTAPHAEQGSGQCFYEMFPDRIPKPNKPGKPKTVVAWPMMFD